MPPLPSSITGTMNSTTAEKFDVAWFLRRAKGTAARSGTRYRLIALPAVETMNRWWNFDRLAGFGRPS